MPEAPTSSMEKAPAEFDSAAFLGTLTGQSGVYRMLDDSDQVLYVGKARDLKSACPAIFALPSNCLRKPVRS
ncbi:MAG: hypothetical protein E4H01_03980 [Lysobacterales bacterium]|nr:MAG: hypothetical protein E4H01_03980 [Xanthomonadales bacterium]